jgi:biopolymer transport protein ExbD
MTGDLTPMIDMAFQLIAFFMLIINFSAEQHHEIELPDSELVKPPDEPPEFEIVLTLNPDGSVIFGQATDRVSQVELIPPFLTREISNAAAQKIPVGDIDAVIRAHKETETGMVQDLIVKCQDAGLQKFKLRVKERK